MNITTKIFIIYPMGGGGIQINIEKFKNIKMFIMLPMGAARIVFTLGVYHLLGCTTYWGVQG